MIKLILFFTFLNCLNLMSQETQTCIDKDCKIYEIDKELEGKLHLFTEYNEFQSASLFVKEDSIFTLEINYNVDGKKLKARRPFNLEEAKVFREKVTKLMNEKASYVYLDQEGRTEFLIGTTALGFGFWGWALPDVLDMNEGKESVATYLLTSAASFFVPFWLTENKAVSEGSALLSIHGGTSGIFHGYLLYKIFEDEHERTYYYDEYGHYQKNNDEMPYMLLTSLVETCAGFWIADATNMSAGKAEVLSTVSTFGIGYGLFAAGLADELKSHGSWPLFCLFGSAAGYYVGNEIANSQNYTRGDAYVLTDAGMLGLLTPISILLIAEAEGEDVYYTTSLLGMSAGLLWGNHLVKGKDFTTADGIYITLGQFAGMLLGSGVGLLLAPERSDSGPKIMLMCMTLGTNIGFIAMYNKFKSSAKVPETTESRFKFDFNPAAAAMQLSSKNSILSYGHVPLINLSYSF